MAWLPDTEWAFKPDEMAGKTSIQDNDLKFKTQRIPHKNIPILCVKLPLMLNSVT